MGRSDERELALLVTSVEQAADDILALTLTDPAGEPLPPWTPGAHIDLTLPSGTIRQYSLCGPQSDETSYRIAVLREREGRGGSAEVHASDLTGQTLRVTGPRNRFELIDAERYLFIAGGIGITPLLAMAREARRRGASWRLVYGGRTTRSMAFVDELMAIDPDRVELAPQDSCGLLDVARLIKEAAPGTAVYCCGPEGLIGAVQAAITTRTDLGDLHLERFGADPNQPAATTTAREFVVECARSGREIVVPADRSILDVVLQEVDGGYPHGCTEGYCGSCETSVLAGDPEHHDQVLTDEEKAQNDVMMICVGRSRSDRLVLDI